MNESTQQFEQAFADNRPVLRAYFLRQQGLAGSADDLVQETFLRAWKHREQWSRAISPRAYLFGIARHVQIDTRRRLRPLDPLDDAVPEARPTADERLVRMHEAIAGLPDVHREPLLLKLEHELSYAEIAAVLEVPIGTVRSRLHHAVLRLRESLAGGADNP